jgi:hypothetical protein
MAYCTFPSRFYGNVHHWYGSAVSAKKCAWLGPATSVDLDFRLQYVDRRDVTHLMSSVVRQDKGEPNDFGSPLFRSVLVPEMAYTLAARYRKKAWFSILMDFLSRFWNARLS